MEKKGVLLFLVVVSVALSGCVGGGDGATAEEVRDGFVGNGSDVSSYAYESETTFEFSPVRGTGTRINTTTIEGVVDYENREVRAEIVLGGGTPGNQRVNSETMEYLVNGTAYDRTVRGSNDTGWVVFGSPSAVNRTWEARDELGFYTRTLENASVSKVSQGQENIDGTATHALRVEHGGDDERVEFLTGKLSDDLEFLDDIRMEEFNTTVWISEEESRLVRAETEATAVEPDVPVGNQRMDIRVRISFVDEFSYDEPVEIELPEGARDAAT